MPQAFRQLDRDRLTRTLAELTAFEGREGMVWLEAMEAGYRRSLLSRLRPSAPAPREKRPFAQLLFWGGPQRDWSALISYFLGNGHCSLPASPA